jgi:hypothetical protein
MALPGIALPPDLTLPRELALSFEYAGISAAESASGQDPNVERFDDVLEVEWRFKSIDLDRQVVTFTGGVRATYGPTVVVADRLVLFLADDARRAQASGDVRLEDPLGQIEAASLSFSWLEGTGEAIGARVEAFDALVTAARIAVSPGRWELFDARAAICLRGPELVDVRAPRLVVEPGRSARAERPHIRLFGQRVLSLPRASLNLDRRAPGLRLPSISHEAGIGLGVGWSAGFFVDRQTVVSGQFGFFPGEYPRLGAMVSRSFADAEEARTPLAPRSEFRERFDYGYFNHVAVRSPADERLLVGGARRTVSLGTSWSERSPGLLGEEVFDKPLEAVLEFGESRGGTGILAQARLQDIRRRGGPQTVRTVLMGTGALRPIPLGRDIAAVARLDAAAFLGGSAFGWGRSELGVVYAPISQVRLGAAYIRGFESGKSLFLSDRLFSRDAYHVRADFDFGRTRLSFLNKYDFERGRWYDREFALRQVVGCLEPFVIYRQFPEEYRFGVRLRLDDLFDSLDRRRIEQRAPATGRR